MKPLSTIEEIKEYVQEDYWENGITKGISGYEKSFLDINWNLPLVRQFLQVKKFKKSCTVLDLGCALGSFVSALLLHGFDAYGIDLSDYAIKKGWEQSKGELENRTYCGSCHNLNIWSDNYFDFLYSNQVFEHIPAKHCKQLAKEAFRVAKKDSVLWIGLVLDISNEIQPQGFNPDDPDKTHINIRPKKWWDNIFTSVGWKLNPKFDEEYKAVEINGTSYYKEYKWHTLCYKK